MTANELLNALRTAQCDANRGGQFGAADAFEIVKPLLDQLEAVTRERDGLRDLVTAHDIIEKRGHVAAAVYDIVKADNGRLAADLEASRALEARYREALRKIASDDAEGSGCLHCTAPMDDVGKHDSWCPVRIARTALDEAAK